MLKHDIEPNPARLLRDHATESRGSLDSYYPELSIRSSSTSSYDESPLPRVVCTCIILPL